MTMAIEPGVKESISASRASFEAFDYGTAFQCGIAIVRELDGFSAHAERLPGAVSQGDTVDEALTNAAEACSAVIREYLSSGDPIPWSDAAIDGTVECRRWILVHV